MNPLSWFMIDGNTVVHSQETFVDPCPPIGILFSVGMHDAHFSELGMAACIGDSLASSKPIYGNCGLLSCLLSCPLIDF